MWISKVLTFLCFIQTPERSEGVCTKSYGGLVSHFWCQIDRKWSKAIIWRSRNETPFRGSTEKVRGSKTTGSDGTRRWRRRKKAPLDFSPPFRPVLVGFFLLFSKMPKQAILFRDFLHEKCVYRKNGVHHDEERGKTKKIAVSDFSLSKLCHRDFRETFSEIFIFWEKMKNAKIAIFSPYVRPNCGPFPKSKN